jgi:hypothetical protein
MYLQNIKDGSVSEIRQIYDLIALLEKRGGYTIQELAEYYTGNSFNSYSFPIIKYRIINLQKHQ